MEIKLFILLFAYFRHARTDYNFLFHKILFSILVQMTARNRVNVSAIDVCAKAIGLHRTAVCMHAPMDAV